MDNLHSGCIKATQYVTESGMSQKLKDEMVDLHNQYRAKANPHAAIMPKLVSALKYFFPVKILNGILVKILHSYRSI